MAADKRRPVTSQDKQRIVDLHKDGHSNVVIAERIGRAVSVVQRIVAQFKSSGSLNSPPKTGRPRKTSVKQDRLMVRLARQDRFKSAAEISRELNASYNCDVSRKTVSRRLVSAGFNARVPASKPLISKKNQKARLKFSIEHVVWTEDQWSSVHFSDESKFNVLGSDGRNYVRRKTGERLSVNCVKKTVKHGGGSVMVWGIISAAGTGPLVRLHGKINGEVYKQIIRQHAIPFLRSSELQSPIFMQDNAPCHTCKKVKSFFAEEELNVMDWPAQSPDLNPIENVWKFIGERAQRKNPKNQDELWKFLEFEWNNVTPSFCMKLVNSCSKRCQDVIDNKGLFTKY